VQLSKKSDYALRAMVELAACHNEVSITAGAIAKKHEIPLPFLEQILHDLKHAGLVKSRLGASGGYCLARAPKEITFGQVIRVMEKSLAPIGCVDLTDPSPCANFTSCRFHQVMARLRDAMSGVVDHTTLADVAGTAPPVPQVPRALRAAVGTPT